MDRSNHNTEPTFEFTSDELGMPQEIKKEDEEMAQKQKKKPRKKLSTKKKVIITVVVIVVLAAAGVVAFLLLNQKTAEDTKHYSILSGEEISDAALNSKPTFCIQIPNGGDVADRTHVGLTQAPIVFEAIAEAGITRFAAIYQNPTTGAIGPIRSLRPYYLEWDTPFDCTVVHAGGSDEALADLKSGNYRDLTENYDYMWRDRSVYTAPNNLLTSPTLLNNFNANHQYTSSNVSAPARMTPDDAKNKANANKAAAEPNNSDNTKDNPNRQPKALVSDIAVNFGAQKAFNVLYHYNADTNSYARSYANGVQHMSYNCPADATDPNIAKSCGEPVQVAPKAIVVMEVKEGKAADGYHEEIVTTGNGTAYIFQNGEAIKGTWNKKSAKEQIVFKDTNGNTVHLTPGQLWISAIPSDKGSVQY